MKHFPTLFYVYLASVNSWTEDTCAPRPLAYVNKEASPGVTIVLAKSETRLTSAGACICLSITMCAQLYANDWTVIMLFLLFARKSIFVSVVFFVFFYRITLIPDYLLIFFGRTVETFSVLRPSAVPSPGSSGSLDWLLLIEYNWRP